MRSLGRVRAGDECTACCRIHARETAAKAGARFAHSERQAASAPTTNAVRPCAALRATGNKRTRGTQQAAPALGRERRRSGTAAVGLQRPAACCNSAPQVRATSQPNLLPIRCNGASPVATALSATTQNCCTRVQSVATAHRLLQQRSAWLCNDATNSFSHPLQQRMRVATAHRLLRQRPVRQRRTAARECSLLQQRIACCNSAQQVRATTQPTLLPIRLQ